MTIAALPRRLIGPLTLGRSFLLWLVAVLALTLVTVSALVLWHEQTILEENLRARADLLAHVLALAAAEGGSPEYLAIISMGEVRAGEVRSNTGELLWRYGPSPAEVELLDASTMRIEETIHVGRGPWGHGTTVEVVLLVSRTEVRNHLAAAAVRLVVALGLALTLALVAGLGLVGMVVRPLRVLSESIRTFDPDRPEQLAVEGGPTIEVRDLARAFRSMAERLAEQRRSLVDSERRYRELFASSPTPLLKLDGQGTIREANPAAAVFLGAAPDRAAGRSLARYLEGQTVENLAAVLSPLDDGAEAVVEARWRLAPGEIAEVELRFRAAGGGDSTTYLGAIHDVTDRVRRLGERWRRTFDAMVDGVALVDQRGTVSLSNLAIGPNLPAVSDNLADRLVGRAPRSWRCQHAGRLLDCSLSSPDGIDDAILVVRDVTEAADAEERVREAEKMQAVGTLASGVAHDFNNLLAAILLHARLLAHEPAAHPEAVNAIRELAEQGSEVVRELLLFARRETTPPITLDLVALVVDQEGVLRHLLGDHASLRVELDEDPVPVVGDPVALRRLLLNLVVNAREAVAPHGGVISIRVEHGPGRAVLEVSDDGPGIPAEVRDRLFEPFFTSRRQGRGSGLGLAVVYSIVAAHGGEIDVRSVAGEGARFIVRLPLGDIADLEPIAAGGNHDPTRGLKVLLVDADGRSASETIERLAEHGMEVRHAPNVDAGRRAAAQWQPAAVVVAGEELVQSAAAWLGELQVPVVALTPPSQAVSEIGPIVVRLAPATSPSDLVATLTELVERAPG